MIAYNGESKLSLSKEDLMMAIELFIRHKNFTTDEKVTSIKVHREGSKYSVSVTVARP